MRLLPVFLLWFSLLAAAPAAAFEYDDPYTYREPHPAAIPAPAAPAVTMHNHDAVSEEPADALLKPTDLLLLGGGFFDFDKHQPGTRTTDMRAEYRFGYSLLEAQASWIDIALRPLLAAEATARGEFYGNGGFLLDVVLFRHLVLGESEAVGLFDAGGARNMGSYLEFRSQGELGWRFDNDMRVTGYISHISNAKLTEHNPGAEIYGAYVHFPVSMLFN